MQHYHGHRDRLKKRLQENASSLAEYELLELLLGYVLLRKDTKPIAKELLLRYETLHNVLQQDPKLLLNIEGIGAGVESFWRLLQEIAARSAESPVIHKEILATPEAVAAMARKRLGGVMHEEMWIAYVDNKNRLIKWEQANRGTINSTVIYPRTIMERALALKASGIIMVHNHPGGDATPSGADLTLTEGVKRAAQPLAIRFIDHIIVTESHCFSLVDDQLL